MRWEGRATGLRRGGGGGGFAPDKSKGGVAHAKQQLSQREQGLHALGLQLTHQLQLS